MALENTNERGEAVGVLHGSVCYMVPMSEGKLLVCYIVVVPKNPKGILPCKNKGTYTLLPISMCVYVQTHVQGLSEKRQRFGGLPLEITVDIHGMRACGCTRTCHRGLWPAALVLTYEWGRVGELLKVFGIMLHVHAMALWLYA